MIEDDMEATVVWLPWYSDEIYGHTDGVLNFIEGTSIKPSIMAYFSLYPNDIAEEMRKRLNAVFDVHELRFTQDEENNWAYVNLIRTEDFIMMPCFGTDSDEEAFVQIEKLYPMYNGKIHPIHVKAIVEEYGGGLNCMSWTIRK